MGVVASSIESDVKPTLGAELFNNLARWYQVQGGTYNRVDPLEADGPSPYYSYVRDNPLSLVDPLGLRIVHVDADLEHALRCALKNGSPEFMKAYHSFDDPWWTGWSIKDLPAKTIKSDELWNWPPQGKRSYSSPPWLPGPVSRLFPGEFFIEPPPDGSTKDDQCAFLARAISHELLERFGQDTLGMPRALTGHKIGAAHDFAASHDGSDNPDICKDCCQH
jgi:RHS repeat-associated protein